MVGDRHVVPLAPGQEAAFGRLRTGLRSYLAWPAASSCRAGVTLGMVNGAVQVPPDGRPVVLGPDHATLGGYPVAAIVITADRGKLGQCRPGDRVRFVPVTAADAVAARLPLDRSMAAAVVGRYPTAAG